MAKFVFAMNQSLDGYVDHLEMGPPDPVVFQHFVELVRGATGMLYGRRLYEIMSYWDETQPDWDAQDREFAAAWQSKPKWVVSHSSKPVGHNATLLQGDIDAEIRKLKSEQTGEIHVGGPNLAGHLTNLGLIDEYRLYLRPIVLGRGTPLFAGPRGPLRFVASDGIGGNIVRLTYGSA